MSKDARDLIYLALLSLLVTTWIGFAGYSVWKDRQLVRASEAFRRQLAERLRADQWQAYPAGRPALPREDGA